MQMRAFNDEGFEIRDFPCCAKDQWYLCHKAPSDSELDAEHEDAEERHLDLLSVPDM